MVYILFANKNLILPEHYHIYEDLIDQTGMDGFDIIIALVKFNWYRALLIRSKEDRDDPDNFQHLTNVKKTIEDLEQHLTSKSYLPKKRKILYLYEFSVLDPIFFRRKSTKDKEPSRHILPLQVRFLTNIKMQIYNIEYVFEFCIIIL